MSKVTTILYGDLALLPLRASNIAREVIDWKTDLFITNDGTEVAEKLRVNARRKIFYHFYEDSISKISGLITEYGAYDQQWAVPLWMETQYIGSVAAGGSTLLCTTDIYDFRASSLALLYESNDSWQIIEINTVGASQLNLLTALEAFTSAYLLPVRVGTIISDIKRLSNGRDVQSEIGFEVEDVEDTIEAIPDQYNGNDFYTNQIYKANDRYSSAISNNTKRVDFQLGKILKRNPWVNNRIVKPYYNLFKNQTEVFDFRQYLSRRSGKYKRYWEPTFEEDLVNIGFSYITDVLYVSSDGFLDWDKQRQNIAVLTTSNTWLLREITNTAQVTPESVALNLDLALNINPEDIKVISFLGLRRLNTDVVEFNWNRGGTIMETTINTIEVSP